MLGSGLRAQIQCQSFKLRSTSIQNSKCSNNLQPNSAAQASELGHHQCGSSCSVPPSATLTDIERTSTVTSVTPVQSLNVPAMPKRWFAGSKKDAKKNQQNQKKRRKGELEFTRKFDSDDIPYVTEMKSLISDFETYEDTRTPEELEKQALFMKEYARKTRIKEKERKISLLHRQWARDAAVSAMPRKPKYLKIAALEYDKQPVPNLWLPTWTPPNPKYVPPKTDFEPFGWDDYDEME